jgi:hypothetical protein
MSCYPKGIACGAVVADTNFACASQTTYVQDQICSPFDIALNTGAISTDIYRSNLNPAKLYVSGSLSVDSVPVGRSVTVNFRLGGPTGVIVETDVVYPGTSLAFTKKGFDTIELLISAGTVTTPNVTGQLCLTERYPVA